MNVRPRRVAFIDIGRVVAAVAVIYTHIDVLLLRENQHRATAITDAIDQATRYLGLGNYEIGYPSVPFFFIVSGFVMPMVAESVGCFRFVIKVLLRVLPLLMVGVVLSALALKAGLRPLTIGPVLPVRLGDVLQNIALMNFLHKPIIAYCGVSWSLLPEVIFYLLLIASVPLLRRRLWLALALEIALVAVVLALHGMFGPVFRTFAANTAYAALALLGQMAAAGVQRRVPAALAAFYAAVVFGLYVWAVTLNIDPDYVLRLRPVLFAIAVFAIGLTVEPWLRVHPTWTALSDRTYTLYLLHGVIAFPVIMFLYDKVPLGVAVLAGLVAMLAGVELAHRLIERPLNDLGRRLSGSPRTTQSNTDDEQAAGPAGPAARVTVDNVSTLSA